ncbi:MAG TPA: hypothetical protein VJ810_41020, partial [Blastocatellia bacterium]|nr:hypothetical protein [Blastocatellia bacterium]
QLSVDPNSKIDISDGVAAELRLPEVKSNSVHCIGEAKKAKRKGWRRITASLVDWQGRELWLNSPLFLW